MPPAKQLKPKFKRPSKLKVRKHLHRMPCYQPFTKDSALCPTIGGANSRSLCPMP